MIWDNSTSRLCVFIDKHENEQKTVNKYLQFNLCNDNSNTGRGANHFDAILLQGGKLSEMRDWISTSLL